MSFLRFSWSRGTVIERRFLAGNFLRPALDLQLTSDQL